MGTNQSKKKTSVKDFVCGSDSKSTRQSSVAWRTRSRTAGPSRPVIDSKTNASPTTPTPTPTPINPVAAWKAMDLEDLPFWKKHL